MNMNLIFLISIFLFFSCGKIETDGGKFIKTGVEGHIKLQQDCQAPDDNYKKSDLEFLMPTANNLLKKFQELSRKGIISTSSLLRIHGTTPFFIPNVLDPKTCNSSVLSNIRVYDSKQKKFLINPEIAFVKIKFKEKNQLSFIVGSFAEHSSDHINEQFNRNPKFRCELHIDVKIGLEEKTEERIKSAFESILKRKEKIENKYTTGAILNPFSFVVYHQSPSNLVPINVNKSQCPQYSNLNVINLLFAKNKKTNKQYIYLQFQQDVIAKNRDAKNSNHHDFSWSHESANEYDLNNESYLVFEIAS